MDVFRVERWPDRGLTQISSTFEKALEFIHEYHDRKSSYHIYKHTIDEQGWTLWGVVSGDGDIVRGKIGRLKLGET